MKKLCAVLLVITILLFSVAVAEELISFFDMPYDVTSDKIIDLFADHLGVIVTGSDSFFSSHGNPIKFSLYDIPIDLICADFDINQVLDFYSVVFAMEEPQKYTYAEPTERFFVSTKNEFLSVYKFLSETYTDDMLATVSLYDPYESSSDVKEYVYTGAFDSDFWASIAEECLSSSSVDVILYYKNIRLGFQVFSDPTFPDNYKQAGTWLEYHNEALNLLEVQSLPGYSPIKRDFILLSIGEWECPDHIAAGEYVVTPVKSATIAVYRNGRLKVNEYLRTDEGDEIGRLVLEEGDTIEIGSGKLQFTPFE